MSVRLFPARSGTGFEFDIRIRWPEGDRDRDRGRCPVPSKSGALRWAQAREAALLGAGREAYRAPKIATPELPTLAAFWPRIVADHYRANRKKASTIDAAESIWRCHLAPALGTKPLHLITTSEVSSLKGALATKGPKTVNNVLAILSRALRCAVEWDILPAMPCRIVFLKLPDGEMSFYEVEEYRRLVEATWGLESRALVLLAGSAGLRRGEIVALRWCDVDLERHQLRVAMNLWRKVEGTPKGGRNRVVPLTDELVACLVALRRGRVVASLDGDDRVLPDLTPRRVRNVLARAARRAGLLVGTARETRDGEGGAIHKLRHTFCSHLAIAGVPAMAIKELAGHADLKTTQRYMHLSPANRSDAIATLSAFYAPKTEGKRRATG